MTVWDRSTRQSVFRLTDSFPTGIQSSGLMIHDGLVVYPMRSKIVARSIESGELVCGWVGVGACVRGYMSVVCVLSLIHI